MTDTATPHERLAALAITLPNAVAPVANYVPFVVTGNQVYVSGQISLGPDGLVTGALQAGDDPAAGAAAARLCALNLMAQFQAACDGDLSRVARIVKLGGFVSAGPGFVDAPKVINGASDLMVEVFGERGRHARSAVCCSALPLGALVEIDAVFERS